MIQSRQIEAFRAVMLTGAMTAAAERLHITQPAVSRLIRDLEAELGFALFHRRGNQVVPTSQAVALRAEVERSFIGLEQISTYARDLREGRGGTLRVAALPAVSSGFLPRFAAEYSRSRPHVRIVMDGLPSDAIRDRLTTGRIELGITAYPFQREGLSATPLEDCAVVAVPEGHHLASSDRDAVTAEDLRNERLILLTRFRDGHHVVDIALQFAARDTPIETPLATMACVLVTEGVGIAVVDPFSASEFLGRGLVLKRFEPGWAIGSALVQSSERPLSLVAQDFRAAFLAHARDFLQRHGFQRSRR